VRLRTKVLTLAVAGTTAGLFGVGGLTNAAHGCGSAQGANVFPGPPSPVYSSGPPSASPSGYVGVGGTSPAGGGYVQATGSAGATGVTGNITASGSAGGQGGTVAVGNDGQEAGTVPANPANFGVCHS